jgi:tetratricopeptide (TPR) repeat protein
MRAQLLIAIGLLPSAHAAWVRAASPRVEVLSNAGTRTAERLLSRFEQMHGIFAQAGIAGRAAPVRVIAFATATEFHHYRSDKHVDGFYLPAPDREYIAMYAGPDAGRVAFHEYVHVVLSHSPAPLPGWFEEGMAEFYSTLTIEGGRLRIGDPIEAHISHLATQPLLSSAQLIPQTDPDGVGIFYSESWALVHMLNLAPGWREKMPQFVLALAEGHDSAAAFREAFGKSMDDAIEALSRYAYRGVSLGAPEREPAAAPEIARMSAVEAASALADFALAAGRHDVAKSLLEREARDHPQSPEIAAGLGAVALAEGRINDARRQLDRAIAVGSRDAATYFEYAMLERDTNAPPDRINELLARTVAIHPDFAAAHFLLGTRLTDDARYQDAVAELREAVRIRPRESNYWYALGYAQAKLGKTEDALASARRAARTASNVRESGMAETLIALAQSEPPPAPARRPDVVVPPSWQQKTGDARIEGVLTRVDCSGPTPRLHVTGGGGPVALDVLHPSAVELVNSAAASRDFPCGDQRLRVVIDYVGASREVTRIEFIP